jgi:hypothetical protein
LYGALFVEDPSDGVSVTDQITLVVSDIGFDRAGVLDSPDGHKPSPLILTESLQIDIKLPRH